MRNRLGRLASGLWVRHSLLAVTVLITVGLGCGGAGGGCGGLKALPKDPGPWGFPMDQAIEGGIQARVTKPGFDKISSLVPELIKKAIKNGQVACIGKQKIFDLNFLGIGLASTYICEHNDCSGGAQGCPVDLQLDNISLTMVDNTQKAIVDINTTFDIHVPIELHAKALCLFGGCAFDNDCNIDLTAKNTNINLNIILDTDPTTGALTLGFQQINNISINLATSGNGGICSLASGAFNLLLGLVNGIANSFITKLLINTLGPMLNNLLKGFLPNPPGIAGSLSMGQMLASMGAPADANLEMLLVAGGYVSAKGGGLNLGVIAGLNSDRDPTTRTPGLTSEASLCVPTRPAPDLGGAPWNLPPLPARNDHFLNVAPEFSGTPDPLDAMGNIQDLAIGVSRTFLDQAGFHIYNSGTLCLSISGGVLAQLNAGTISVLIPSLQNILENRKGPVAVSLRPQQPLLFNIGTGTMTDPLLGIRITDLRVDFYTFIEERYVRLFTLALDMNVGLNLTSTKDKNGKPAITAMITGIDKTSVQARVTNTDLLQEDPKKLAKSLLGLIDVAVGALMGGLPPIALPSIQGFSLDNLNITRVQTKQDDFLAIFGSLVQDPNGMMFPLPSSTVPFQRDIAGIDTTAQLLDVSVPPPDVIYQAVQAGSTAVGSVPSVTLKLGAQNHVDDGRPLEWSYRLDGLDWKSWSTAEKITIVDPVLLLQSKHFVDVRARVQNDWTTEDDTPERLEFTIDSAPPELKLDVTSKQIAFKGWDNVTDDANIRYAWNTPNGWSAPGHKAWINLDDAWAASNQGKQPLQVRAIDELDNVGEAQVDLTGLSEFHGRTTAPATKGGCGCDVGGAPSKPDSTVWLTAFAFLGLFARRLLRQPRGRFALSLPNGRRSMSSSSRAFTALVAIAIACATAAGCNCQQQVAAGCKVDDDCRSTQCDKGQIPQCMAGGANGGCGCTDDIPLGDVGRFASMAIRGETAYVAAYNGTYGDLCIGHLTPPGRIDNWEFVDGVPDNSTPQNAFSKIRGGVTDPGDDVGRYTSLQLNPQNDPVVAYYDVTNGALKFGTFGAIRWEAHVVDKGVGVAPGGDTVGKYAQLSVDPRSGNPGIAYYAQVKKGISGFPEGQLRFAQAKVSAPHSAADWTIFVVDPVKLPVVDPMSKAAPPELPEGPIFPSVGRKQDGSPVIAYYDRQRGNLKYVEFDPGMHKFGKPITIDGEAADGTDTGDVGQYPSIVVTQDGVAHISYIDSTHDNLLYVDLKSMTPEVVDDGYRPKDEMTLDGLASPVYHLVGDNSSIQLSSKGDVLIAYQDSTVLQLRLATREAGKTAWTSKVIAGHASPFAGAYGFYAQNRLAGGTVVLSTYAINQHRDSTDFWVELFGVLLGIIG